MRARKLLGVHTLISMAICALQLAATAQNFVDKIEFPKPADFRSKSWSDAFDSLHEKISREYAFTEWKRIDWKWRYAQFAPRIADAQAKGDETVYQIALREYVYSIPDGHCGIRGDRTNLRSHNIAGSYGFAVAQLHDSRIIAHLLLDDGPAAKAGMRRGAEIREFNGQDSLSAVQLVPVIWSIGSPATPEHAHIERRRYLTRASVGSTATVTFINPGEQPKTVTVTAESDGLALLKQSGPHLGLGDQNAIVYSTVLPSGYGYVRISQETGKVVEQFASALKDLIAKGVPGLVVDLRTNGGGDDQMAADLGSFFHRKESFYEYAQFYNVATGAFDILKSETVMVKPHAPYFQGPVVGLIGPGCVSSGEGVAWQIGRAPKGNLVGFAGTNGSFGMSGMSARMPGEAVVHFPFGTSLDVRKRVQIDSDHTGRGGIQPTVRVRRTYATMMAMGAGEDVELAEAIRLLDLFK